MKRVRLLSVLLAAIPLGMMAQDDLYFNPAVDKDEVKSTVTDCDGAPYYGGLDMSDDEYNRRHTLGSYYQKIGTDSLGNDIVGFYGADGTLSTDTVYPFSSPYAFDDDDDFAYSRRMGRFDNFYGWYDPYFSNYWYDPWYANSWAWGWRSRGIMTVCGAGLTTRPGPGTTAGAAATGPGTIRATGATAGDGAIPPRFG